MRNAEKIFGEKYKDFFYENLLQSTQNLRLGRRFTFHQAGEVGAIPVLGCLFGATVFPHPQLTHQTPIIT
jgi:hypothetical protein